MLPISITSKQQLSNALLTMILRQSAFLLRNFDMHPPSQLKYMKWTLKVWLKSSDWLKTPCSTPTNSQTDTLHSLYDVQ